MDVANVSTGRWFLVVTAALLLGCTTGDGGGDQNGTGGSSATGGSGSGEGGTTSTGGSPATGGSPGTGGQPVGTGGHTQGTGGQTAGTGGGSGTGTGGHVAGTGGQAAGTGGGAAGTGGHAAGTGGAAGGQSGGASGRAGAGGSSNQGGAAGASSLYNPCPTNGDPCRILPVGDSITYGINEEGSYRIELFHDALQANQKITYTGTLMNGPATVDGVAFPPRYEATVGITIAGISAQITQNKTLSMPADIVLVHIGTNDMYMSDPGGAPTRLGMLLDQLTTGLPNALIVVAKIIPLQIAGPAVTTFNAAIPGIVQTRVAAGKHIIVVDLNTGFPMNDFGSDDVHPDPAGYTWMGDKWYAAIGSLFPR